MDSFPQCLLRRSLPFKTLFQKSDIHLECGKRLTQIVVNLSRKLGVLLFANMLQVGGEFPVQILPSFQLCFGRVKLKGHPGGGEDELFIAGYFLDIPVLGHIPGAVEGIFVGIGGMKDNGNIVLLMDLFGNSRTVHPVISKIYVHENKIGNISRIQAL